MDLNRLLGQGAFGMGGLPPAGVVAGDTPQVDNSEIIYISPLSLLKVRTPPAKTHLFRVGCLADEGVDVETCSGGSADGSHGSHARRIRR